MANYHKWTEEEDKVLVQYVAEGNATKDIADLMGFTVMQIKSRISFLKRKGIKLARRNFKWTTEREKELAKILSIHNGNLKEGFKVFAEKYNLNIASIQTRYYRKVKNKYPIFSVFGRYRGIGNAKIYRREDSKGYKFWSIVKQIFD